MFQWGGGGLDVKNAEFKAECKYKTHYNPFGKGASDPSAEVLL